MKKFASNLILFFIFFIPTFIISILAFIYIENIDINEFPALNFSDSYSYNEKIRILKLHQKADSIFAIGSSMTLNNIDSKTIIKSLKTSNFFNAASWGMSLGDDLNLIKYLDKNYTLRKVIIISNIVDFNHKDKMINYNYIDSYLKDNLIELMFYFAWNFNFIYYKDNFEYAKKVRHSVSGYDCLHYDDYGTANLSKRYLQIDSNRWQTSYLNNIISESQYNHLNDIVKFCKSKKIKIIFVQSPFREKLYSNFNESEIRKLTMHIRRIKNAIETINEENVFIDSNEKKWNDSLFADAIHFNNVGAEIFTKYFVEKLDSIQKYPRFHKRN
jgi:hypothetical protein